jgi:predicted amidophosphoribosyltransferase
LGGKSGKKIDVLSPLDLAASSAHESGPSHPPDTTMSPMSSELTSDWSNSLDLNFLEPIIPTCIIKEDITIKNKKSRLYHHKRSFMGCFSVIKKDDIDYASFREWKNNPKIEKTEEIAEVILPYITNYYDFITTAPPSKNRDLNNYCTFKLCETLSYMIKIPFIVSFKKREKKSKHGRHESIRAELPILVNDWNYINKSILFIDDFITSGMTVKYCYNILRHYDNHVDGLIYCKF